MYITFCDTTLRDGEQTPGVHFGTAQKLDIAKRLRAAGVDVIEAGFPASSPGDAEAVRRVAEAVGRPDDEGRVCTVSALSRMMKSDIDITKEALAPAARKRLHLFIATSDIHLDNKLKITREEALAKIRECVSYAAELNAFDEIQFSAEDATRSDFDFLTEAVLLAVACGVTTVGIPDTVGYTTPSEITETFTKLRRILPDHVVLGSHCHNDLGLATANSLAALEAGASYVECTVNGLGERAGNAPFEEVVMALKVRGDSFGKNSFSCGVRTAEIAELSELVASLSGVSPAPNKAIVGKNAFSHASGVHQHGVMQNRSTYEIMNPSDIGLTANTIVLGKLSGRHAFADRCRRLGYSLTQEGIEHCFGRFKEIADKKSVIANEDIRAIVSEYLDSLEGKYWLNTFQIQSGNHIKAMALLTLDVKHPDKTETITEAAPGEGPIDAAFNAINRIAGVTDAQLVSYNITAITEGTDALGEAKVKLKSGDITYTGRGVSTDVIKASIKAYLNAVNKLVNSMAAFR